MVPIVQEVLAKRPLSDRRTDILHPSEMAKSDWCHRSNYYRLVSRSLPGEGKGHGFVLENIFAEGNFIHEKWQLWLRQSGKLWGSWKCRLCSRTYDGLSGNLSEVDNIFTGGLCWHVWDYGEVQLHDTELMIAGHEDGAVDDFLIEFKSVGVGTLRVETPELLKRYYRTTGPKGYYDLEGLWKDLSRPVPSHLRQVNLYMHMAAKMGLPFTRTAVVYEAKWNQQVKEFTVKPSPEIISPLLALAAEVAAAVDSGTPPPCRFGGCAQCRAYEAKEITGG